MILFYGSLLCSQLSVQMKSLQLVLVVDLFFVAGLSFKNHNYVRFNVES